MGPRLVSRGNLFEGESLYTLEKLQWGRDSLVAEMLPDLRWRARAFRLQWGRDSLVAEMCSSPRHHESGLLRFNGAATR